MGLGAAEADYQTAVVVVQDREAAVVRVVVQDREAAAAVQGLEAGVVVDRVQDREVAVDLVQEAEPVQGLGRHVLQLVRLHSPVQVRHTDQVGLWLAEAARGHTQAVIQLQR